MVESSASRRHFATAAASIGERARFGEKQFARPGEFHCEHGASLGLGRLGRNDSLSILFRVWGSLKRILNSARAWAGITLVAILGTEMTVKARWEGWNAGCRLEPQGCQPLIMRASLGIGLSATADRPHALRARHADAPLILPRRPILITSPTAEADGSPTMQHSSSSLALLQPLEHFLRAVERGALLVAGDEQAERAVDLAVRARQNFDAAAAKQAIAPFMSTAPRP